MKAILWVPLAILAMIVVVAIIGLSRSSENTIKSQLVGRQIPEFALEPALPGRAGLSSAALRSGEPRVVNLFASWCVPCRIEAPQLEALAERDIPVDGIAIRDRPEDLAAFLAAYGDPFRAIGADNDREVQMALGSAGVPETFVIGGDGVVRHQHIGVIDEADLPAIIAAYEAAK